VTSAGSSEKQAFSVQGWTCTSARTVTSPGSAPGGTASFWRSTARPEIQWLVTPAVSWGSPSGTSAGPTGTRGPASTISTLTGMPVSSFVP
jgi:hypothetical protein